MAVDVGGTFTDVFVLDEETAQIRVGKVPSTPDDPGRAVLQAAQSVDVDLRDVVLFSHGTTVATNALITRRFPPAAMVTTTGFRDVIEIRDGTKDDLWDAYKDVAGPYIRRRDRYEVTERIDYNGAELVPLDEAQAREVAGKLRKKGIKTVAVCFANSYANGDHERRMKEILEEELPGVRVSTSSEILPEIFEHDRFSTTVANAVLAPLVGDYVQELGNNLRAGGYAGDLLLLHSGGGSMTDRMVQKYAVRLAASGIAAGAIACRHLAAEAGFPNAIGLDMGGSSTDITLRRLAIALWDWSNTSVNSPTGSRNRYVRKTNPIIAPAVSPEPGPRATPTETTPQMHSTENTSPDGKRNAPRREALTYDFVRLRIRVRMRAARW
ncbi:MAG: hydantoinase/oxoprolinase N-terminal domain-containing protein [Actinomycetales bacterium]